MHTKASTLPAICC